MFVTSSGVTSYDSTLCWWCGGIIHKRSQWEEAKLQDPQISLGHIVDCELNEAYKLLNLDEEGQEVKVLTNA
jgi:hypothetical protein